MKKNYFQTGSMSAIIIAVLFVALMATLGVVFYQNFIQKKPNTAPQTATKPTGETTKAARVAFEGVIYALDYPDNWKKTQEAAGTTDKPVKGTKLTLTSPNGKVAVLFEVDAGYGSSACDKSDGRKVTYYNVISKTNFGLMGAPLSLVETLYDHLDGGYDYLIGLAPESGLLHASIGDPACNITSAGVLTPYRKATPENPAQPRMFARIIFPQLPTDNGVPAAPDMQTVRDLMASDEYKAAIKVLESARKE